MPHAPPWPPTSGNVFEHASRNTPGLADITWLTQHSTLPVLAKGVLHPQDAQRLRQHGAAGIIVSNHGGRTVDGVIASLAALPAIRQAVGPDYPLLPDSGVRSGLDIFKAIACGADAVMIGRLQLYALAVAGALGIAHMLRLLKEELQAVMAVAGCFNLSDIRHARLHSNISPHQPSQPPC